MDKNLIKNIKYICSKGFTLCLVGTVCLKGVVIICNHVDGTRSLDVTKILELLITQQKEETKNIK